MADYVPIQQPQRDVDSLDRAHTSALSHTRAAFDQYTSTLSTLDENPDAFPDAKLRALRTKAQQHALGAIHNATGGDPGVFETMHARAARALGIGEYDPREDATERLARSARHFGALAQFRPPIVDGESTAADLRTVAEAAQRDAYARRIARLDAAGLVAEVARITEHAGADWHAGSGLAQLYEIEGRADALTGADAPKARAAVFSAWRRVGETWPALRDMHGKLGRSHEAMYEIGLRAARVRDGVPLNMLRTDPNLAYARWKARQAKAA